ncbi:MAG: hypothetical protein E2P02_28575 [Acidobacteria bacterium]|nr:MAG: hypothetical protein E2P02_28575 [Acidobacteriota bacterium]
MKVPWYRLPTFLALIKLFGFREELRHHNLHNTQPDLPIEPDPDEPLPPTTPRQRRARTADGTHNDLDVPEMGKAGARFGRNVPLNDAFPDKENLLIPNPRTVSNKLLARKEFVPATKLNLLAAAWIHRARDAGSNVGEATS